MWVLLLLGDFKSNKELKYHSPTLSTNNQITSRNKGMLADTHPIDEIICSVRIKDSFFGWI